MLKKITISALLLVLFISLTSLLTHKNTTAQYLTVKVYESALNPKILIISETGALEEIPLQNPGKLSTNSNAIKINESINMVSQKGYELINVSSGDYNSIYVFIKR